MATNFYFQSGIPMGRRSESILMEDLIIECLKIYGHDLIYLPRTAVNLDEIFNEDPLQKYSLSYTIEGYLENVLGFQGENDLLTKFGVEIRDKATFIISRRRWIELSGRLGIPGLLERPSEGDIVFFPLTNSFFDIKRVEVLDPFFQVGKLYVYKLECELMQASAERFDTGIEEIDTMGNAKTTDVSEYELTLEDDGGSLLMETVSESALILEDFDIDEIDNQSQNNKFVVEIDDVLDFTESNPFGDIRS